MKCVYEKGDKERLIYEVIDERNEKLLIRGIHYRIIKWVNASEVVDADDCLVKQSNEKCDGYRNRIIDFKSRNRNRCVCGKVLHLDGDQKYLNKCLDLYKELGVYCYGVCVSEEKMPNIIKEKMMIVNPDVVVITGHDLFNNDNVKNVENYTNSKYYIDTIKEIRKIDKNCVIIAGACQSHFEALIASGANFASSPKRINIHTFDPVVIALRAATTSITKIIDLNSSYKYIENGREAFGGVETFGKMRLLI